MMISSLLLALAPQITFIPLDSPAGDDDGVSAWAAVFTVDGRGLIVPHRLTGTVTLIATAQARAVSSNPAVSSIASSAVTSDGSRVLFAEHAGNLEIHALPSMAPVASVPIAHHMDEVVVDRLGVHAVVLAECGQGGATVVDIASATVLREFPVIAPNNGCLPGWGIAADETSLIGIGRRKLLAYDLTSGQLLVEHSLGAGRVARRLVLLEDRTRAFVVVSEGPHGSRTLAIDEFALPGLTLLSSVSTSARGGHHGSSETFSISVDGTRAVIGGRDGTLAVDLTNGTSQLLDDRRPIDVAISVTGTVAVSLLRDRTLVHDVASGALLEDYTGSGYTFGRVRRSPSAEVFAVLGRDTDRVILIDATQPGVIGLNDISSGLGEEGDGPFLVDFLGQGRLAAAAGRDSDDVRFLDMESGTVVARFQLHREPTAIAAVDASTVAVAHGRGAVLDVIDSQLGPLASIPLGQPADQIEVVPQTALVWVHVVDAQSRSLLLVDTAAGAISSTIALAAPAGSPLELPPVAFDLARGRAFALDPVAGTVTMLDLAGGLIVDVKPLRPGQAGRLFLAPDGGRLTALSSGNEAASFTVQAAGLTASWTYNCIADPVGRQSSAMGFQAADGSSVVLDFVTSQGNVPPGQCDGILIFDTSTGAIVPWGTIVEPWLPRSEPLEGNEVVFEGGPALTQRQFIGTHFALASNMPLFGLDRRTSLRRDPASGRTVGTGWENTAEVFAIVDPLEGTVTQRCDPAVPNATGFPADLELTGGGLAGNLLVATVRDLEPNGMAGYLLVADAWTAPTSVPMSPGLLCLGGSIGRFVNQVQTADAAGTQRFQIDTSQLPLSSGAVAAQPGESWTFQSWYRDRTAAGAPISNFSSAETILFR